MTSTSEIAETKILSPFFSSVVMIRRAVGESCFESERYQIHRGYPGPPPSGNVPREATPHFATGFGDVFFTHLHTQVRPKTEQASPRSVPGFFLYSAYKSKNLLL